MTVLRLALRDLRGGLAGFRVFLVCLMLGVAGIAAVGSIAEAISRGLAAESQEILGGDISVSYTYRFATEEERAWLDAQGTVSEIADLRSMIGLPDRGGERALSQVKGVDRAWPLYGEAVIEGASLDDALAARNGIFGLVTEPVLAERLGLREGDRATLGTGTFEFRGVITQEPDVASQGFNLGPRTLVSLEGLRAAGLLSPGTLYSSFYRVRLPDAPLSDLKAEFSETFPEAGARWNDRRNAAPGIERFVQRMGAFLILVGLAALAIGGVGIGAAVRGYLSRKTRTIAALRTIGATGNTVFALYLIQVAIITLVGIGLGLGLGAGAVALAGPMIAAGLPVPAAFGLYTEPLVVAAIFGAATAALFTLWPLAWLREIRPATLFREGVGEVAQAMRPGLLAQLTFMLAFAVALVLALSGAPRLAGWVIAGLIAAFVVLRGLGWALSRLTRRLSHSPVARNRPGLRLALGAIGAPGGQTPGIVVALGLALGVLAAIGQIDANLQRLIRDQLPASSPAFFFVDIQNAQLAPFTEQLATEGASRTETAPMLRGVITRINDGPAREAKIDPSGAWVLRGDRGVSYSATPPPGTILTEGSWWPEDYTGEPLV
ncbi:MAG: FtsX-like permease family protein, partial [Pseudomonadota bacterium]